MAKASLFDRSRSFNTFYLFTEFYNSASRYASKYYRFSCGASVVCLVVSVKRPYLKGEVYVRHNNRHGKNRIGAALWASMLAGF